MSLIEYRRGTISVFFFIFNQKEQLGLSTIGTFYIHRFWYLLGIESIPLHKQHKFHGNQPSLNLLAMNVEDRRELKKTKS